MIPPAKRGGNKRTVAEREVVSGVMYILGTSCQWAALPKDVPPRSTRKTASDPTGSDAVMPPVALFYAAALAWFCSAVDTQLDPVPVALWLHALYGLVTGVVAARLVA